MKSQTVFPSPSCCILIVQSLHHVTRIGSYVCWLFVLEEATENPAHANS